MVLKFMASAFLLVLLLSPAAAQQTDGAQTDQSQLEIGIDTDAVTDQAIKKRLDGIFGQIDGLSTVDVSVNYGVVKLGGYVQEDQLASRAVSLAKRVDNVVAVNDAIHVETSVAERLVPVFERLEARTAKSLHYVPLLVVALVVWVLVAVLGLYLAARAWPWSRIAPNAFIADLLRQIVRIVFVVIGGILALDILGATALLGTLLGAAGIVGLAVGFAVRDTVENYIASILLSIRQPFRPKDFVKIDGFEGFVLSLTSRATILMESDGNHIRIPNATVFKSAITNYTVNPQRRFSFKIGVDADSDLDRALKVGLDAIMRLDFILDDPTADAWIDDLGDSNVVLSFVGWIDQSATSLAKARSEAMRLVKQALESNGFSLPEPIYRLRFDEGTQLALPAASTAGAKGASDRRTQRAAETQSATPNDTRLDTGFEERIDRERRSAGGKDLLNENAPTEFGKG